MMSPPKGGEVFPSHGSASLLVNGFYKWKDGAFLDVSWISGMLLHGHPEEMLTVEL